MVQQVVHSLTREDLIHVVHAVAPHHPDVVAALHAVVRPQPGEWAYFPNDVSMKIIDRLPITEKLKLRKVSTVWSFRFAHELFPKVMKKNTELRLAILVGTHLNVGETASNALEFRAPELGVGFVISALNLLESIPDAANWTRADFETFCCDEGALN